VSRALEVGDNVVALLRAAFIEGEERREIFERCMPRHTWFLGQRVPFIQNAGEDLDAAGNPHMMAIFWWDLAWNGPSTWSRLDYR
jgi:hypothetical protein